MRTLIFVICIASATFSRAQEEPALAPQWMINTVKRLKEQGLLVGYPDGRIKGPRTPTRYEAAVAVHAAYDYFTKILDAHEVRIRRIATAAPDDSEAARLRVDEAKSGANLRDWKPALTDVERLARALRKELDSLGVDTSAMFDQLARVRIVLKTSRLPQVGEYNKPFSDVPSSHWASEAVHTLKKAGLLVGYPHGKFRG